MGNKNSPNYWMFSTVFLLGVFLFGTAWFLLQQYSITPQPLLQKPLEITGVIRTSGLSDNEKQRLTLTEVNYQVTDFLKAKEYSPEKVTGYYLLTNNISENLLGKCVTVFGYIPNAWKNKSTNDMYQRTVLTVTKIEKVTNSSCDPYEYKNYPPDLLKDKLVLRGIVVPEKRPAPDIGYDYSLKLTVPFVDEINATGKPQKMTQVTAIPASSNIWIELENNINKEVTVEGYMRWGYSESRYLEITSIKNTK